MKRYRFTGKERDEESGLYYHGARYCAPWIGRWISCDPSGIGPDVNLYAYTGDNPVRYRDPDGRDGQDQNNPQGQDNPAPGKAQPAKTQTQGKKEDSSSKASKAADAKDDKDEEEKGPPDVTSYLFTAVQSAGEVTNKPEKGEPVNRLVVEALLSQTVLKDKLSASQVEALVRTVNQTRAIGLSVQVQGNLSGDSKGDYTITVGGIYHAFRNHDDKRNTPEEKATGVDVGVYVQPLVTVAHSGNDTSVSVGGTITGALSTDLIDDTLTLDLNASGSLFTSSQLTDNKTTLSPGGSYAFNAGLTYKFGNGWQIPLEGSVTYTSGYAQTPNATVPNTSSTSSTRFTGGLGVGKLGAFGLKFLGAEINVTNEAIHPPFFAPSATKVPSGGLNIIGVF